MHCVDLGESFPTHIYLQNLASIQPRTSPFKFARSPRTDTPGATFLAHYFNTFFIFIALFVFMFTGYVFADNSYYGSPGVVLGSLDATSEYA